MKNSISSILFILAAGQLCRLGLPWWGLAPIAAVAAYIFPQPATRSMISGFAGGFLLWVSQAWWLDERNGGVLSARVGELFLSMSGVELLLLTGLLGGLLAGLAALTGGSARGLVSQVAKGQ